MANSDVVCPVDHKKSSSTPGDVCPVPHPTATPPPQTPAGVCPIDHTAREAWLKQARAANPNAVATPHPIPPSSSSTPSPSPSPSLSPSPSWSSTLWSYLPFTGSKPTPPSSTPPPRQKPTTDLAIEREISTIPRATGAPADPTYTPLTRPSNHEIETGADPTSGNWIYPSEKMFFEAMKRKGHDDARATDMKTVVPIHNAVNERAWAEIKVWEAPYLGDCGGPKLHSFSGLSTKLTPKARVMTWMGYQAPFDRHDWVVDRCGRMVEYVIDFYPGKPRRDGVPSFYLDVRPKLNSWEGVKMRVLKGVGIY